MTTQSGSLRGSRGEKYVWPEGLKLRASLLDGDAVLEAADRMEPEKRVALKIKCSALNEGHGREWNGNIWRLTCRQAGEPLASDADNRERMPLDANLLSDNVASAAEAALPEFIPDNGDLRVGAAGEIFIFGIE